MKYGDGKRGWKMEETEVGRRTGKKGGGEVINGNGGRESGWKERDKEKREV